MFTNLFSIEGVIINIVNVVHFNGALAGLALES